MGWVIQTFFFSSSRGASQLGWCCGCYGLWGLLHGCLPDVVFWGLVRWDRRSMYARVGLYFFLVREEGLVLGQWCVVRIGGE